MNGLVERMRRTIAEQGMLQPQDRLLVAVSGGPDSLAMLHALWAHRDEFGLSAVQAAHLDHGLRGEESAADADFVQAWCAERGIACSVGKADVPALQRISGQSVQEAARAARYAFLEETAREIQADKIATGHSQDDQVETVLLNILRGTGLDGLRGIPYRRGVYIRPLRDVPRAIILAYGEEHRLCPRIDPSNSDASHYTRNRIRLELLPLMEQAYHPMARQSLLRLSENSARDADYLHQQAEARMTLLMTEQTQARMVLDARRLKAEHPALLRYILRAALTQIRGTPLGITQVHLQSITEAVMGCRHLPFGLTTPAPHCMVRVTERRLTLKRAF